MSRFLVCPSGHRWEIKPKSGDPAATVTLVCPVCGGAGHETESRLPPTIADTRANSDAKTVNSDPPPGSSDRTVDWPPGGGEGDVLNVPEPPSRVNVPGYEVLTELGRGGMGVVYKANQVGLHRVVALKMILAGQHASPQELNRFKVEAEAVARLVHPNVVQIYDIGEHEGLPYFSLEYVGGGSLAQKLHGKPMPGREAAELIETLSRAVHAAHERGIIHRDLKPANVLLTEDGSPKITDFGLAKKLEEIAGGTGTTRTGSIMGTPSYMAPEQAGDRDKPVGPHTDVYALGAILYECLSGRPPFHCDNPVETVMQVLDHEPEPPRSIVRDIDPSLEAICLKCLEKNPRDRYARAEDLADDLRAYLDGEPVQADKSTSLRLFRVFLRETRHTEVMALWGKVWMWHAGIMLALLLATAVMVPFFQRNVERNGRVVEITQVLPYALLWGVGLAVLAAPIWYYRFRSGLPLTLIERQMGQMWFIFTVGFLLTVVSQYYSGGAAYLEIKSLLPLVMLEFGLAFGCMAVILGGSFYGMSAACLLMAVVQTAVSLLGNWWPPDVSNWATAVGVALFGVVFFVGLFVPGRKYSRAGGGEGWAEKRPLPAGGGA